jgi:hypothetical protein
MGNNIDIFISTWVFPSIVGLVSGYFISGWYSHRAFRDNHYKFMRDEAKKQSLYLKILTEKLAPEELDKAREEAKVTQK